MHTNGSQSKKSSINGVRMAIIALSGTMLTACVSSGADVWQGGGIHVEARQQVLESDVYEVNDNHRELKDRFDALERLYVELVQGMQRQEKQMAQLHAHVSKVQKDPEIAATMQRVSKQVTDIRQQMKKLENRMYSVEVSEQTGVIMKQTAPTGTSAGTGATNASPSVPVGTPVSPAEPAQEVFFGVHLASYRSKEQVTSGWAGLEQNFGGELEGLTPLVYTQSQEGIGTFMRLIAGPLITEQEAVSLCSRIREAINEQYCRVSEYQGDPIS